MASDLIAGPAPSGPPRPKEDLRLLVAAVAMVFVFSLAITALPAGRTRLGFDDAYITYQYARNIAQGHGFVFNATDRPSLGTSAPLYALLLAAGGLLGIGIPQLSVAVGIVATSIALCLVVCIAWECDRLSAGLVVALLASVGQLYWWYWQGMETPFCLALTLGSIWTAFRGWASLGFTLAAVATVTRLDALAVLVVVGLLLLIGRGVSWRALAPGAVLLILWLILATAMFGSPLPTSGRAKMAHESAISGRFSATSLTLVHQALPVTRAVPAEGYGNHPRRTMALVTALYLGSLAAAIVLRPRSLSLALGAWLLAYLAGYELLRVPSFSWYYGPPAIVIALLLWMGLHGALALVARRRNWRTARLAPAATLTMGLAALAVLVAWTPRLAPDGQAEIVQAAAGRWLRDHAAPGDTVVAFEVGAVAYRSGLKTIDLLGLTDPAARVHLQASDFAWAIRGLPTYVFSIERGSGTWPVAKAIFDECAFALNYRPALRLPFRADTDYVVYRRAPEDAGAGTWLDLSYPSAMRSGSTVSQSLVLRNDSPSPVSVTYAWRDEPGRPVTADALRTPLPCDVVAGRRVLVSAAVRAPERPGIYTLTWEVVDDTGGSAGRAPAPTSARVTVY
jgi:arabinofuranosyltransferase